MSQHSVGWWEWLVNGRNLWELQVVELQMITKELDLVRRSNAELIGITTKQLADLRLTIAAQREEARKPAGVARSFREIQSFIGEPDA
jgi:hypothetical protein